MGSLILDLRYAWRAIGRTPLFALGVASTIGLGLCVLCSGFAFFNANVLRPIDLPDPQALHALSWDTASVTNHRFSLSDLKDLRERATHFSGLVAGEEVTLTPDNGDSPMTGLLVTGDYFTVLGARATMGRLLREDDAAAPGERPVAVLSEGTWRARYGADPSIVGKQITLGRQRFEVVGVIGRDSALPGQGSVAFWAPLTMAAGFSLPDLTTRPDVASLFVVGRLRPTATLEQGRAWFDLWLSQRFPPGSESAPVAAHIEPRGTRLPLNPAGLTLLALVTIAFWLVLLVACANVTNLLLARAFGRRREIAVRLSLGASRWHLARQLTIESLVLAVPAALVGLVMTMIVTRAIQELLISTFPSAGGPVEALTTPLGVDIRVAVLLCAAAVTSAVLVTLAPALRATRMNLVRGSKGESAWESHRSRLQTALVALQIGACALFLVGATGLIRESTRLADPDPGLDYERVVDLRVAPNLRADVAARLGSDPQVDAIAAAWRAPLLGPLPTVGVVASGTRIAQDAGFMVVSPEYFPLLDVQVVRGRAFTTQEADGNAPVVLVSQATALALWPGLDPIGQTLDLTLSRVRNSSRRPVQSSVRVVGVTKDVVNGPFVGGVDRTCVYFPTGLRAPGEISLLVKGRTNATSVRASVMAAVNAIEPGAAFQVIVLRNVAGVIAWAFRAFSAAASTLGVVGLILAFSGTYAIVAFLVTQRTREFGIRMAIGATASNIIAGILREALLVTAVGLASGLAVALALGRAFSGTIPIIPAFHVGPYVLATAVVLGATVLASLLPSLRAASIDPSQALRAD